MSVTTLKEALTALAVIPGGRGERMSDTPTLRELADAVHAIWCETVGCREELATLTPKWVEEET